MNNYQQQEFEQQDRIPSGQYIFQNPLLPSPVISSTSAPTYHSQQSSDHQQQCNTQQHNEYPYYPSALSDYQSWYTNPQQGAHAHQQPFTHSTYPQAYTLEQHYQDSLYDNTYHQSYQNSDDSDYPSNSQPSQSRSAQNDRKADPPIVAKVSQTSYFSGALDEPVLQHSGSSYNGSTHSSLIANVVDHSRWNQQITWPQDARYQHSSSNAYEFSPPSRPQTEYNVQEFASISYSTDTGTSYHNHNNQPQSMPEGTISNNHQDDHATAQSCRYVSQTSYVQTSSQVSNDSYPADASQAAYAVPQSMLPPFQTGPRPQPAVPPAIFPNGQRDMTPPPVEKISPASVIASPTNPVHPDPTLPIHEVSITPAEYIPAFTTSAASSSSSGQHQAIVIPGTLDPSQESPQILEGGSGDLSPNGGESSNATNVDQLDENREKPFLPCEFCRKRKLACGQAPVWENADQLPPGPITCDPCLKRGLECFYTTETCQKAAAVMKGGITKKRRKGKAKKSRKVSACHRVRAVDADWVLARR
ncbi:hypothetical protein FRC03_009564 [Tulasnella sp. 419]|nr:hypothetical protein FRC03_009564 [Tulasnella sp. 419]